MLKDPKAFTYLEHNKEFKRKLSTAVIIIVCWECPQDYIEEALKIEKSVVTCYILNVSYASIR